MADDTSYAHAQAYALHRQWLMINRHRLYSTRFNAAPRYRRAARCVRTTTELPHAVSGRSVTFLWSLHGPGVDDLKLGG